MKPHAAGSADGMTIGQLATVSGAHVETIRYYQRQGLMPTPKRPYGSIRRYGTAEVKRLRFIKRAQTLGFSLEEVGLLLRLSSGDYCLETQALAEQKLALVQTKLDDLLAIESALKSLVSACRKGRSGCGCPIIDRLIRD